MATNISAYLGNKVTRWIGGQAFPAAPASVYVALFLAGVEVTTNVRVAGRVAAAWTVPGAGSTTSMASSADVDFGLSANAQNVDEVRLYDAATVGNILYAKTITTAVISANESVKITAGNLTVDNS